jgi:hypothetical protein
MTSKITISLRHAVAIVQPMFAGQIAEAPPKRRSRLGARTGGIDPAGADRVGKRRQPITRAVADQHDA